MNLMVNNNTKSPWQHAILLSYCCTCKGPVARCLILIFIIIFIREWRKKHTVYHDTCSQRPNMIYRMSEISFLYTYLVWEALALAVNISMIWWRSVSVSRRPRQYQHHHRRVCAIKHLQLCLVIDRQPKLPFHSPVVSRLPGRVFQGQIKAGCHHIHP